MDLITSVQTGRVVQTVPMAECVPEWFDFEADRRRTTRAGELRQAWPSGSYDRSSVKPNKTKIMKKSFLRQNVIHATNSKPGPAGCAFTVRQNISSCTEEPNGEVRPEDA